MTRRLGHDPYEGPTPERPRYVLLFLTQNVKSRCHFWVSTAGSLRLDFSAPRKWRQRGNAPTMALGAVPRRPPAPHRLGGGRPAPGRGAHGALAPQRPGARVGASREAHGPDGGRPARLGLVQPAPRWRRHLWMESQPRRIRAQWNVGVAAGWSDRKIARVAVPTFAPHAVSSVYMQAYRMGLHGQPRLDDHEESPRDRPGSRAPTKTSA